MYIVFIEFFNLYLLDLLFWLFFLFVGCQQTKQIAHVMSLNQDYISKGKVTC